MNNTMTIEIQLTDPITFLEALHQQIPSTLEGNRLILDQEFGTGGMRYLQLQEGLFINQIDLQLKAPLTMNRQAKNQNDYFILNFHTSRSDIIQKTETKEYKLGFQNINILLSSACAETQIFIPPHAPVQIFNIGFTRKWLEENILADKQESVYNIFQTNDPIYLFENINYTYKKKLKQIDLPLRDKLTASSIAFQLLDYFFTQLSKSERTQEDFQNVNLQEFSTMVKVREGMDDSISQTQPVEDLAKQAGMSLSKFKTLFKQFFGTTPYQYYLTNRMEKSMELLEQKTYSVSEVGYLVGYANLSQFSKSFQKHFGVLPSEVK